MNEIDVRKRILEQNGSKNEVADFLSKIKSLKNDAIGKPNNQAGTAQLCRFRTSSQEFRWNLLMPDFVLPTEPMAAHVFIQLSGKESGNTLTLDWFQSSENAHELVSQTTQTSDAKRVKYELSKPGKFQPIVLKKIAGEYTGELRYGKDHILSGILIGNVYVEAPKQD